MTRKTYYCVVHETHVTFVRVTRRIFFFCLVVRDPMSKEACLTS